MKLSLVTAIRDGFPDFRKTVPSILSQTLRDFEWIIADDASEVPVERGFPELAADPRVRILRVDRSLGQTVNLNRAIREAEGDWIVRIDGDDLCHPARLEETRRALAAEPCAELFFSDYSVIDESDREWALVRYRSPLPPGFFRYLETRNNPICHPTVTFRKFSRRQNELRQFREDLRNAQDYALWKRILAEDGPRAFHHIPLPLVRYRIAKDSLSGARAGEQRSELEAIRKGDFTSIERPRALDSRRKDAMQSYRILYYCFVGAASPSIRPQALLALLRATIPLPGKFLRALMMICLIPLREPALRILFSGIYR